MNVPVEADPAAGSPPHGRFPDLPAGGTYTIGKRANCDIARTVDGTDGSDLVTVELVLTATELTEPGFVCDFGDLSGLQQHVDQVLDHQDLDKVLADPTDAGIRAHVRTWAQENLPDDVHQLLDDVRVFTGRVPAPADDRAVRFRARHWLCDLPEGHKCGRQHGHAYLVTLPDPDQPDNLLPVPEELREVVLSRFHGQVLNAVFDFNPTCEHLAAVLTAWLAEQELTAEGGRPFTVRVSETASTWSQFTLEAA
ncbi:6-carboxytetrahydropterin synthase [Streptomyces sp. BE303]|uniref:6-carboxytetrahydropterin synthase n=1 Tax=Streptomyces sp. BE303 TaxID=3002528 RepID=UPI002E7922CF|nr:6-carboxytetrahydropterin synthase [Streptomyces sp. BE303]MED7950404.1 6-carboxytetrahydropterin synthase [Streptomyces sp. BE303]